jgi:tungstate transport system ATP-binding protein
VTAARLVGRGLVKRYHGRAAVAGVDVVVEPGRIHALLGPSGSGKSTLVRLLHELVEPDEGSVELQAARTSSRLERLRRFGLVQQSPGLLRASARANVAFPLRTRGVPKARALAEADAWLERLGLADRSGAPARDLSGGEAQRVAIARALAPRPDVVFLDEATNQLDPRSVREVEAILREEARGRGAALVLVSHSVAQARRLADDATFLDGGRAIAQGRAADVLSATDPRVREFVALG